ncbi:ATP-dependent zinc protease family protein [Teredinibacter haidensis]|uniref:ATP-dependent zinc protease family protein n=1 Tax=Teredinibacter haidensis TaxID=2731755 RepID=UPI000948A778|nr:RimK/LysX family protein [Teredinibacter haidensis]
MSRVVRFFILLALIPLLVNCTFIRQKEDRQLALQQTLDQQRQCMEEQAEQLEEMTLTQKQITEEMQLLRRQVREVHAAVTRNDERGGPVVQTQKPTPAAGVSVGAQAQRSSKIVIGRIEWAWLELAEQRYKARVDTGVEGSSLMVKDVQPFERNGSKWIRFRIPTTDEAPFLETPLLRYKKNRNGSAESERRPVVNLLVRVGEINEEVEFNLIARDSMVYPVLLGRNFLRDIAIVDVAQKFIQPKVEFAQP